MSKKQSGRRSGSGTGSGAGDGGSPFKGVGSHVKHSIEELVPSLVAMAANIPDVEAGREQVKTLTDEAFHAKFSASMAALAERIAFVERERAATLADLDDARDAKTKTPEWLPAAKANHGRGGSDQEEVKWRGWQFRHKLESIVIAPLLIGALGASMVTAHSNLVGTGLPVFLGEGNILPWTMASLAPASGLALKVMGSTFRTDYGHRRFTAVLNGTTLVLILGWTALFAENFHGLSSSAAPGGLFDSPSWWDEVKDTLFVAVTLLTEIGLGAVLANRLERLARYYAPDYWVRNLESESLGRRIDDCGQTVADQTDYQADLHGQRAEYDHSLKLQIELACLAYDARRARFDASSF